MRSIIFRKCLKVLIGSVVAAAATASPVTIGTVNLDLTGLPGTATIDIANQTGPNSTTFPDTTFPVSTAVSLSSLSLMVDFSSGPAQTFGSSYFTLAGDGLSFNGQTISVTTPIKDIILSGAFTGTSWTLNDGTSFTADPNFSATISDPAGTLADGDFGIITAYSGSPEPESFVLLGTGLCMVSLFRRLRGRATKKTLMQVGTSTSALLLLVLLTGDYSAAEAATSVKLNTFTVPSSGISGTSLLWLTGSGFPVSSIDPAAVTIQLQTSCGATGGEIAAMPLKVTHIIGSSDKMEFQLPASLPTGNYFVSLSGTATDGTAFISGNCSEVSVTHSSAAVGSCNPGSSMGMLVPSASTGIVPVTAYIPNGYWSGGGTGLRVVQVEGGASPVAITTPKTVNSCSTDSVLGTTICTANNTDIYIVNGSSLTKTLTSGSNTSAGFSGGSCQNCGVAVNAVTHQAVITMGYSPAPSGSALQFLDLNTLALGTPVPSAKYVSEDVLWDPFRNLILSPNEQRTYNLFKINGSGLPTTSTVSESTNPVTNYAGYGYFDSTGEDCTTGIALASDEVSGGFYIVDLTQATYTSGTSSTWSAPGKQAGLPELYFDAGTDGIAVAPGSTHLGIVAGEFGGSNFGAFLLPSTSGTGTPSVVDYVSATMPVLPSGSPFTTGYDPHTTTAYTSPNDGKAYGVMADWSTGAPAYLAIVDLQALMNAPRSGAHTVISTYDLIAHGVVRYVATK